MDFIDCGHFQFIGPDAQECYDRLIHEMSQPVETLDGRIDGGVTVRRKEKNALARGVTNVFRQELDSVIVLLNPIPPVFLP